MASVAVNHDDDALARIEAEEAEFRPARREIRAELGVLVAIALGGALGALARYGISRGIHVGQDTFPWATFVTNITGAFVLGLFLTVAVGWFPARRYPRPFFAIGFLGAFTTFSTLAVETVTLIKDGDAMIGVTYMVVSIGAGLMVAFAGIVAGRALGTRC
jgi:CrcB protein